MSFSADAHLPLSRASEGGRGHSVCPMPNHLSPWFPCRIFSSFILLQTMRYVGISGNGKTGLRAINTQAFPQIYVNIPSTHKLLVSMVYPLHVMPDF